MGKPLKAGEGTVSLKSMPSKIKLLGKEREEKECICVCVCEGVDPNTFVCVHEY